MKLAELLDLRESAGKVEYIVDTDQLLERLAELGYDLMRVAVPEHGPALLCVSSDHKRDDPKFHALWLHNFWDSRQRIDVLHVGYFQSASEGTFPNTEDGYDAAVKYFRENLKDL